nr:DUF2971 domain-containing protein [Desulfobulbaceae bacterium]
MSKPPPIFYKFMPLHGHVTEFKTRIDVLNELLLDGIVWFSNRSKLNDPFDSYGLIMEKGRELNECREFTQHALSRYGFYSLASSRENPLMWSHYTAGHTGICIHFDSQKLHQYFQNKIYQVIYSSKITIIDLKDSEKFRIFLEKDEIWSYENEYRIIHRPEGPHGAPNLENGFGLKYFPKDAVTSISFGVKTSDTLKDEVRKIVNKSALKIDLDQAQMATAEYKLLFEPVYRTKK